jgi:hypothetical protein
MASKENISMKASEKRRNGAAAKKQKIGGLGVGWRSGSSGEAINQ